MPLVVCRIETLYKSLFQQQCLPENIIQAGIVDKN